MRRSFLKATRRSILTATGLATALFITGCGSDDNGFGGFVQTAVGLRFSAQPTQGSPNTALSNLQMQVVDSQNNLVGATVPVTLSLTSNPTGAVLSGTTSGNTVSGTIDFSNLAINLKGTYRITATVPGLGSVTTAPIQIGGGTPVLGAANNINAVFGLFFIHSADLNKDGRLDMVSIHPDDNRLSVFLGNGSGGFGAPTTTNTGTGPQEFAIGDWNRDGNLDLAVTLFGNLGLGDGTQVQLFAGNGAGGFAAPTTVTVGTGPFDVATGDFNGDTLIDLAVTNFNSANFSLLLGNGVGGFGAASNFGLLGGGAQGAPIVARDFNGDGRLDVAIGDVFFNRINLFNGNGAGGFAAPTTFATENFPRGLASADFNGDGRPDLASANRNSNSLSVLINNGAGFNVATTLAAGTNPNRVAAVDFNGDSRIDLICTNSNSHNASLFLGNGDGSFGAAITLDTGAGGTPVGLDVADYNNDTNLDLGIANYITQFLSIFLQQP